MNQQQLTEQEQARRRIQKRRKQRILRQRRQRRRRILLLAVCILCVILLFAACHILRSTSDEQELPSPDTEEVFGPAFHQPVGPKFEAPADTYADVDITPLPDDPTLMQELKKKAAEEPKLKKAIALWDEYPEALLKNLLYDESPIDFILAYPEKKGQHHRAHLHREANSEEVPLLFQWDERWGYEPYGSSVIGLTGCGPTCLSMVALYLTDNARLSPAAVAKWAEANGYYIRGSGTSWTLMSEGSAHFGLEAEELRLVEQHMIDALKAGHPIICSMGPGDFTRNGHYIVLTGYDPEKGFSVNDPNSPELSEQFWDFKTLEPQINNLWAFSKA